MPIDLTVAMLTVRHTANLYGISKIEFQRKVVSVGPYFPATNLTDSLLILQLTCALRKPTSSHLFNLMFF